MQTHLFQVLIRLVAVLQHFREIFIALQAIKALSLFNRNLIQRCREIARMIFVELIAHNLR